MGRRRLWICTGLGVVLGGTVLTALLEPNQTVRAFLAGEAFYRMRPSRHWREVLREDGRRGHVSDETRRLFVRENDALPILRELARDPDANVRWPAIALLGRSGFRTQAVLEALRDALRDEALEVRLQAIAPLGDWGPTARPAIPDLAARLHDPELQAAHVADLALWQIDVPAAVQACGWRTFTSAPYRFSVMLPGQPEQEDKPLLGGAPGVLHAFMTSHRAGPYESPTRYALAVSEYPAEVLASTTEEQRLNASRDWALFGLGGKLVREQPVEQHGRKGREQIIEVEGKGVWRSRQFWVEGKLYLAAVVYQPRFLNARAADYFLDSFRVEEPLRPKP